MPRPVRRAGYANVVATLALAVALSGTSYAATQLTGKDVKNESLKGRDVKDGSLSRSRTYRSSPCPWTASAEDCPPSSTQGHSCPPGSLHHLGRAQCLALAQPDLGASASSVDWTVGDAGRFVSAHARSHHPDDDRREAAAAARRHGMLERHGRTRTWSSRPCHHRGVSGGRGRRPHRIVEIDDDQRPEVKTCKRYDFTRLVALAPNSRVNLKVSAGWGPRAPCSTSVASRSSWTGPRTRCSRPPLW